MTTAKAKPKKTAIAKPKPIAKSKAAIKSKPTSKQKNIKQIKRRAKVSSPKKPKQLNKGFVQDFIPIKDIKNGAIYTTDGRCVKIVEIKPLNFSMRTPTEQRFVIDIVSGWLKIAPDKIQIKTITRRADTDKHIDSVIEDIARETNPQCRELGLSYLSLVQSIKDQKALSRRFFIIFSSDGIRHIKRSAKEEDVLALMNSAADYCRSKFKQAGNEVVTFENREEETKYLCDVMYQFFNRKSASTEKYEKRESKVDADFRDRKKTQEPAPVINKIAPRSIDMTNHKYYVMDGLYYTVVYLTSNGYPTRTHAGWLASIANAGDGVDVDVHLEKVDRSIAIADVNRRLILNRAAFRTKKDTSSTYEELAGTVQAGYDVKNLLSSGEDLYIMQTYITISATTREILDWKRQQIVDNLRASDILVRDCKWQMEEGFAAVLPLACQPSKSLTNRAVRNISGTSAAALYPFTAFELCDDEGILLGTNKQNSSLTILDTFDSAKCSNSNCVILGSSGKGKTFLMSLLAMRWRMRGVKVFMIAPTKGLEFRRVCKALGGTFAKIAPSSPDCVNILQIRNIDRSVERLISGEDAVAESLLIKKIDQIHVFFSILLPDISYVEQQLVDEALMKTYAKKGITTKNDSLYADAAKKKFKQMPILEDLLESLKELGEQAERLVIILGKYVTGSAQVLNGHTNVDIDSNKFIVFDLSDLSQQNNSLTVSMFIVLDFLWDYIKSDRTERKAIFIDEVWQLIGSDKSPQSAGFVHEIYKTVRAYNCASISASQDLQDFFALDDGKYGRAIINNSSTKIILGMEPKEAEMIGETMMLTPMEKQSVITAQRGEALVSAAGSKVMINVIGSDREKELITTSADDLIKIAERKRQEQGA